MIQKRIAGCRLAQHIGEQVILLGTINRVSANGKNIELLTTDSVQVNVTLNEVIDGNTEGYIEVHGTIQSKATMSCSHYVIFPSSMTTKFSASQYNDYLAVINVIGTDKWLSFDDDMEL